MIHISHTSATEAHLLLVLSDFVTLQFQAVNVDVPTMRREDANTDSRIARSCFVIFGTDWLPPMDVVRLA